MDRLDKSLQCIRQLLAEKDRVIVAIEGNCASGKTTLTHRKNIRLYFTIFRAAVQPGTLKKIPILGIIRPKLR